MKDVTTIGIDPTKVVFDLPFRDPMKPRILVGTKTVSKWWL